MARRRVLEGLEPGQPLLQSGALVTEAAQPRDQRGGDDRRGQFALARQQRRAALVELADHGRTLPGVDIIKDALQLVFDEAALLLDDQHVLQAFGKTLRAAFLQRPGQRDFIDAQAQRLGIPIGNAEIGERLAQIEIGLAGGYDPKPRRLAVEHDAVELVGACEGANRRHFRTEQPPFLLERRIGPADVQSARRHLEIGRQYDLDPRRIAIDRGRALDRLADRLEADPAAGIARQRKAVDPEIEIVLQRRRVDDRDQRRGEHLLALMRQRRGLAAVIVAGERQHAAISGRAGRIGVLQGVDRAVDAGTLAVPDAEHAIDLGARKETDLLAAPDRGRGEILVQPGNESDIMRLQEGFGAPQRVVVHAERRAAVAGDEARRVQAGGAVAFALQHRQPDQRLNA